MTTVRRKKVILHVCAVLTVAVLAATATACATQGSGAREMSSSGIFRRWDVMDFPEKYHRHGGVPHSHMVGGMSRFRLKKAWYGKIKLRDRRYLYKEDGWGRATFEAPNKKWRDNFKILLGVEKDTEFCKNEACLFGELTTLYHGFDGYDGEQKHLVLFRLLPKDETSTGECNEKKDCLQIEIFCVTDEDGDSKECESIDALDELPSLSPDLRHHRGSGHAHPGGR